MTQNLDQAAQEAQRSIDSWKRSDPEEVKPHER